MSEGAIQSGNPRACTSALATAAPTRSPVKLPGPSLRTRAVTSSSVAPASRRTASIMTAGHQRVGGAGGMARDAQAAGDRLDEGGLSRAEVAFEGEQRPGRERAAEGLALGLELRLRELADHAWRRSLGGGPRRTSGAPIALRSLSWSRSIAASSNSRLAAA